MSRLATSFLLTPVLLSSLALGQSSKPKQDWHKHVQRANEHRRIMLRAAAGRRVASGGDAAVPAILAYEKKVGRNRLQMAFVFAFSRTKKGGKATLALLERWAKDRDFYWRSQALMALANRKREEHRPMFREATSDVAYLTRIQGGRGLIGLHYLGNKQPADEKRFLQLLQDQDPRVRNAVAVELAAHKDPRGLPVLLAALPQTAEFLEDPWGPRESDKAFKALRRWAGKDFGYQRGAAAKDNTKALAAIESFARKLLPKWTDAKQPKADHNRYAGGMEIRSCRNGDLFLRWDGDGRMFFGLENNTVLKLPKAAWSDLHGKLGKDGEARRGKVVCDFLRFRAMAGRTHLKCAPGALPQRYSAWLTDLADALEAAGHRDQAVAIRQRLGQFTAKTLKR